MSDEPSVPKRNGKSGRLAFALWIAVALLLCVAIFAGVYAYLNRSLPDARSLELGLPSSSADVVASRIAGTLAEEVDFLRLAVAEGDLRLVLEERNQLYRGTDEVVRGIISEVDAAWRSASASAVAPPRPIADNDGARALRRYLRLRPAIEEALVVDRYGAAVASSRIFGQYDFSNEGWFRNTLATGQSAVVASAEVELALVLPMPGNAPTPRGALWAELDPSALVADAVAELEPLGLSVAVVARSGRLVYPVAESGRALPDSVLLEAAGRGLEQPEPLDSSSGRVFAATARVPDRGFVDVGSDLGWNVLVWRPAEDLSAGRESWLDERLRALWIALAGAALFTLLAAVALSRPLTHLRRVAAAAEDGSEVRRPSRTGVLGVRSDGLATLVALARRGQEFELERLQILRDLSRCLEAAGPEGASATDGSVAELLERARQLQERQSLVLKQVMAEADRLTRSSTPRELSHLAELLNEQTERLDLVSGFCRRLVEGDGDLPAALRADLEALSDASSSGPASSTVGDEEMATLSAAVARASDLADRIGVLALNASIKAAMVGRGSAELGEIVGEIEGLGRSTRESLAESAEIPDGWLEEPACDGGNALEGLEALRAALAREQSLEESAEGALTATLDLRTSLAEAADECKRLLDLTGEHVWVEADAVERIRGLVDEIHPRTTSSSPPPSPDAEDESSEAEADD